MPSHLAPSMHHLRLLTAQEGIAGTDQDQITIPRFVYHGCRLCNNGTQISPMLQALVKSEFAAVSRWAT